MAKKVSDPKAGLAGATAKPLPKVSADGKTIRAPLTQNPHAIRDTREKVL
ncbi:MerR family transcriptional regulator, partial [Mesorhizobium sp. M7A.F.Ca.CA.004.11.1.1]